MRRDIRQHYELDAASVHYAYEKRFRYFKLCEMQSHGDNYIVFYEFDICGVTLHSPTDPQCASDFITALHVDHDFKVIARPRTNGKLIGKSVEFKNNGQWVHGIVSRENEDEICIKRCDKELVSFIWMKREDIPKNMKFDIKGRGEMSRHTFAAAVGTHGDDDMHPNLTGYTFQSDIDFEIPLLDTILYTDKPDTGIIALSSRSQYS